MSFFLFMHINSYNQAEQNVFCLLFFLEIHARDISKRCHYKSVMHINANTVVFSRTILLVPYGKHHVKK
jgi:hypothetical protein